MKNLFLWGLLIVAPSLLFSAETIRVNASAEVYIPHGQASRTLQNLQPIGGKILAKSTADSPDPYWFLSFRIPMSTTDFLSQNYPGAKGNWRWELKNASGTTTASGNVQVAPGISVLVQLGLSATTDDLDVSDPDNPLLHLTTANYNGGTIEVSLSGRILPFQQCTGLTNINDTFPLCEQGIYNHGGNGQHNWKYDISIGEQGAETLPTGSGLSGTTFG